MENKPKQNPKIKDQEPRQPLRPSVTEMMRILEENHPKWLIDI
jgi:hypothetical protein